MTSPGLNEKCFCGSGKKFKHCCRRLIQIGVAGNVPVLSAHSFFSLPLTFHAGVLIPAEGEDPRELEPYMPLSVVGRSLEDVVFDHSPAEIQDNQVLRVGFCNKEYRLLVQIRTESGVFELRANEVLKPGMRSIVVVIECEVIKLYVDGREVERGRYKGSKLAFFNYDEVGFGNGKGVPLLYQCYYRSAWSAERIKRTKGCIKPPESFHAWVERADSFNRVFGPGEYKDFVFCWYSKFLLELIRPIEPDILQNFLALENKQLHDFETRSEANKHARTKLSKLINDLQALIDDPSKTEPDILELFKIQPLYGFLINSDSVQVWREKAIQGYGQIDLVLKLVDNSFQVVELESPHCKIFLSKDGEFAKSATHAMSQVERWLVGASKNPTILMREFGSSGHERFTGAVVMGRSQAIDEDGKRETWFSKRKHMPLFTWDDVLDRGRMLLARFGDSELDRSNWS